MLIRLANENDVEAIYRISNEPSVRSVSFKSDSIDWNDHCRWFTSTLKDEDILLLAVINDLDSKSEIVGQVRFNRMDGEECEISMSIGAQSRGKGIGRWTLESSLQFVKQYWGVHTVVARIKENNEPSLRFFKESGFLFREESARMYSWGSIVTLTRKVGG